MEDTKPVPTPMTPDKLEPMEDDYKPHIAHTISVCSHFLTKPGPPHEKAVKRILHYLKGTIDWELVYRGPLEDLVGYTDSNWAGDTATRHSTAGYIFNLGSAAVSWSSK